MTGGRRILIVDDDAALRHSLAEQLQKLHEEFSAAQAETGAEALEVTKREHFDAIVLDVGLTAPCTARRNRCRSERHRW
jgi:DNA-binding response OmpR family regulator